MTYDHWKTTNPDDEVALPPWGRWEDEEWGDEFNILYETTIAAQKIWRQISETVGYYTEDGDDNPEFDAAINKTEWSTLTDKAEFMANEQWIDPGCLCNVTSDWSKAQFFIYVHQPENRLDNDPENELDCTP